MSHKWTDGGEEGCKEWRTENRKEGREGREWRVGESGRRVERGEKKRWERIVGEVGRGRGGCTCRKREWEGRFWEAGRERLGRTGREKGRWSEREGGKEL